ncbi:MAG: hypothetical protein WDO69_05270 [Pseudomonadota bacterium]
MTSERSSNGSRLVLASRARPFATVVQSDFGGPRSRQRLVVSDGFIPAWLFKFTREIPATETVIAVAGGRAKDAVTTRVRAIIVYPATEFAPEIAYVYLEEWLTGAEVSERSAPFHVVRCAALPEHVRFVEVPQRCHDTPSGRSLRPV